MQMKSIGDLTTADDTYDAFNEHSSWDLGT